MDRGLITRKQGLLCKAGRAASGFTDRAPCDTAWLAGFVHRPWARAMRSVHGRTMHRQTPKGYHLSLVVCGRIDDERGAGARGLPGQGWPRRSHGRPAGPLARSGFPASVLGAGGLYATRALMRTRWRKRHRRGLTVVDGCRRRRRRL